MNIFIFGINRYNRLQVDTVFFDEYVSMHARWRHNGRWIWKGTPTTNTRAKINSEWTHFTSLKVCGVLYHNCVCPECYLRCVLNLRLVIWKLNQGNPQADRCGTWVVRLQCTVLKMTSRQLRSPNGVEENSPNYGRQHRGKMRCI